MLKKCWLLLLPLITGLLWIGAAPSHAAGESWTVVSVDTAGCGDGDWELNVNLSGLASGPDYRAHTTVTSGGLVYMNEDVSVINNGPDTWGLYDDFTYGAVPNPGTYPIPAGQPMSVTFDLELPKGTLLSSWTMVAASCDSTTLLYNGPTAADLDHDFVATPSDLCPALQAFTSNGCSVRERTLTLKARYGPRRVVGQLDAPGYAALEVGRTVKIWKKRPGPDRKIATRTTNSLGKFKVKVGTGRYYATSPGLIAPASGEALADISNRARVR
jgi:hypothetical protein